MSSGSAPAFPFGIGRSGWVREVVVVVAGKRGGEEGRCVGWMDFVFDTRLHHQRLFVLVLRDRRIVGYTKGRGGRHTIALHTTTIHFSATLLLTEKVGERIKREKITRNGAKVGSYIARDGRWGPWGPIHSSALLLESFDRERWSDETS